ncbi:Ankyrin-3-like protein [Cladobotryum mycophilum]|uniref:Ankyrin-3-like protein n=1 Tax=Cladobotryum mycophilum TaxID=491253 RepID=A0ABR0S7H9_9HYPO
MSDSDSSSDSSASRAASPAPESVPQAETELQPEQVPAVPDESEQAVEGNASTDADGNTPATDAEAAEPGAEAEAEAEAEPEPEPVELGPDAEPLHITSDRTPGWEENPIGVDIVVVHGVYGSWSNEGRAGPGSGSSEWVPTYADSLNYRYRVSRFEYEPLKLFAGRRSREAIRNCALKLLRALAEVRKHDDPRRLIIFVAHDIGGIIVKDALAAAALDRTNWMDIYEMSRILVFLGCPHRSLDNLDMEERLSRFLYASYDVNVAEVRPSVSSIADFAAAVTEINGLFVESKITLRSRIVSVHGRSKDNDINQAFDAYSGTMGIPMEKRILKDYVGADYSDVREYLGRLEKDLFLTVDAEQLQHERKILTLSSPVYPLQSGKTENPIAQTSQYKAWLNNPGPQILYLHGTDRVRDVAEQVFYSLEDLADTEGKRAVVLYFSFDRWDVRCDSLRDMLSTFMAEVMCHYPRLSDRIKVTFARLRQERGWTEADLIYWFERFRFTDEVDHVMFVINYFDECTKGSQKLFLENFAYLSQASEAPWKVVVTSHKPNALSTELHSPWSVNLDLSTLDLETNNTNHFEKDMTRLIKLRPDLILLGDQVREELQVIDGFDPLVRRVIWEQARVRPDWPDKLTTQEIFGPLDVLPGEGREDYNLEQLLQWVLQGLPEQATLRRILTWLLYSVRPLTIWELATVIYLGSEHDQGEAFPSSSALDSLISKIQTWFAGIIQVEHNEVKIRDPRLRSILMGNGPGEKASAEPKFLWGEVKQTAHFEIAKLCLEYLSRPSVKGLIEQTFQITDSETFETPTFADRGNLCSYALQAWTHHFLLGTPNDELTQLLSKHASSELAQSWATGYWALSNPVTRSVACLETLFPIFAGFGRLDVLEPRDEADTRQGLLEASSRGQTKTVQDLLQKVDSSESTLMEVLVASGACGNEDLMLELLDRITSKSETPDSITWPPILIHRAAWLGLARFTDKILSLGCSPDAEIDWMSIVVASPLSQAARNFHTETVRALLRHNADINYKHLYGRTPIHHVAGQGHAEIAKILVEEGKVDLESDDDEGFTTLYFACLWGHHHVAEVLLEMGADPDMGLKADAYCEKWSPLVVAADDGFKRCIQLLLEKKANPNISGPTDAGTALRYAALKGYIDVCRLLLDNGADPNSTFINPPILTQVMNDYTGNDKQLEIFDLLLSHNADANAKDGDGVPVLMHAVKSTQAEVFLRKLLDHGADVNITDSSNETALYWASENHKHDLVELLLEKNPDVNIVSSSGVTALYYAVPEEGIVRMLLEKGGDPDISRSSGFTCLMYAAWFSHIETIEHLLKHNATLELVYDADDEDLKGCTALSLAATYGNSDAVRVLAEAGANLKHTSEKAGVPVIHYAAKAETLSAVLEFPSRIDVNQVCNNGWTAIHLLGPSLANIKRLVNAGAGINIQDTHMGDTPLSLAAFNGDLERVKYFLKNGANINLGSSSDGAPLLQACRKANFEIVKYLVENGADVNQACDGIAGTPLQATCVQYTDNSIDNREEMVEYLIDNGAEVSGRGGLHGYPINAASIIGKPSLVNLLLDKGATVEVKDDMGRMPIHNAAFHGIDNFQAIVDAGGDVKIRDEMGRTVLHWAAQAGRVQVLEKLTSLLPIKEVINDTDLDGWTALCWAARGTDCWLDANFSGEPAEQIRVIKLLLENGADRTIAGTVNGHKWTPVKIARFHGQSDEVINLLKNGLESEGETRMSPLRTLTMISPRQETCEPHHMVRGPGYHCTTCIDFDLCFKCYPSRKLLHPSDHESWDEKGPEFEDTPDAENEDNSSDTSSSDSDSDSG